MKEKSLINGFIFNLCVGLIAIIVIGQVEFNVTVSKKRINIFESLYNVTQSAYNGYKAVRKVF